MESPILTYVVVAYSTEFEQVTPTMTMNRGMFLREFENYRLAEIYVMAMATHMKQRLVIYQLPRLLEVIGG